MTTNSVLTKRITSVENLKEYDFGDFEGKTAAELDIHRRYGVTIFEIRRESQNRRSKLIKNVSQNMAGPSTPLEAGDILYLMGAREKAENFANDYAMQLLTDADLKAEGGRSVLDFYDIGMAEIVLMPSSKLINSTLIVS